MHDYDIRGGNHRPNKEKVVMNLQSYRTVVQLGTFTLIKIKGLEQVTCVFTTAAFLGNTTVGALRLGDSY